MYRSGWTALADPTGTDGSEAGSVWPLVGSSIVNSGLTPVGFVNVAVGGSSITTWIPLGGNHSSMETALEASGNKTCRAVLFWQGETDALASMAQATYYGHLQSLAAAVRDDMGAKLIPCKLQNSSGISDVDEARMIAAVAQAWAQDVYTEAGPDLSDLASDDSYHLQTNGNLSTAATRWYAAISTLYYAASSGVSGARIFTGF
jgi:hypothetical protein